MNFSQLKIYVFQIAEALFGTKNVRDFYIKKCIDVYRKFGYVFIHIPKSGGTSVANALYGKRVSHIKAVVLRDRMGTGEYQRMFSFAVVRNPYDRLVSAYHYAKQGGGSEGGIRRNPLYKSNVFGSFSSFVNNWLIFQNPEDIDLIFRPQYIFVTDNSDNVLVKWLGKIERKTEIESTVFNALGLKVHLEKRNTSKRNDFRSYYNSEIQELVYDYYKKDFELFDYPKAIPINN